ncbi:MAG TPA: pilus (MSHA type) biogenesis protein MshL [Deltaproteobacteria bacterium]|nr:pilus (MSHA type) biogenesis protein MshL [Deltaproteobacteria bacterium]HPR53833.1 pilus (MSHA type) biogenesis protein MshL [Deltaproteobacteria bacterium]HXK45967.1 pilus (MSHA type) biogenesis protein MshL [Deltaproteobacteria bacterium]
MSKHIESAVIAILCLTLLAGCAVDRSMKKEDFTIEREKAAAVPVEPRPAVIGKADDKKTPLNPLKGKTITLTASKAAFTDVYAAIAEKAGLDLVIDSRLAASDVPEAPGMDAAQDLSKGKTPASVRIGLPPVSISFNRTPLEEALENLDSALHIFSDVKKNTLYVKGTESRTYHLNFLSSQKETTMAVGGDVLGSSTGGSSTSSSSSTSGGSSSTTSGGNPLSGEFSIRDTIPPATNDICTQIENVVKTSMTPYGTYSMNRALGFLEVNDMRDAVERIDAYIRTIKTYYNAQVLITAKVIEVSLKDESKYGIDWTSIHGTVRDYAFNPIQQNLALSTDNLTPALEIQVSSTKHGFDAAMNALEQFGDIKVLSNPRIRVTNGQPALISVGTNTSYIQEIKVTTTSVDGGTSIITPEVTVGSIFDGIMLGVVPSIDLDTNAVNLSITPIKSRIVKLEERSIEDNIYTLPTVGLEEASSQIRVSSGNIIALGGLISKNLTTENTKIPILGDIPYLGYLFKQETKAVETAELVILLEPVILAQ